MRLTTNTQVSVDGVMEGNGGQDQNRSGFERGGWARPLFDSEAMTFVEEFYRRADAFLHSPPMIRASSVQSARAPSPAGARGRWGLPLRSPRRRDQHSRPACL